MGKPFQLYLFDIIGLLIVYQSVIFGIFLLTRKQSQPRLIYALEFIYLTIILHFSYILLENHLLPKAYMLGLFFGFLYGPLFFLYTQSLILKKVDLRKLGKHFFIAGTALICILILNFFGNSFLVESNAFVSLLVTIHLIGYLIYSLWSLNQYRSNLPLIRSSLERIRLDWLRATIYLILVVILIAMAESFISPRIPSFTNILITLIFTLILILVNALYYLGFRQVELFPGFEKTEIDQKTLIQKYDLPSSEKNSLSEKLNHYILKDHPYKDFDLTLNDLAKALEISPRKLSFIINDVYRMNFFEYINSFRLKEAKKLLKNTDLPIKEIMYDSGFGNKSTFNAIFKKHIGQSPSDYRKNRS